MRQKNLDLSKELDKLLHEGLSIFGCAFESYFKQVKYFYPDIQVSRDWVRLNQSIEDENMAYLTN